MNKDQIVKAMEEIVSASFALEFVGKTVERLQAENMEGAREIFGAGDACQALAERIGDTAARVLEAIEK